MNRARIGGWLLGLAPVIGYAQTVTPKIPVVDTYQNVKITDDYRWLEDAADPRVKQWTEAQNTRARAYFDGFPGLADIRSTLQKWNASAFVHYEAVTFKGGIYFALKFQPPKNQPLLVAFTSPGNLKDERVVLDLNALDAAGKTSIDFYVPSVDAKRVAVSLSQGGSEAGTLHLYEVKTGKELPDQIPRVNKPTAGGSMAWASDGAGFYYTRYPGPGERPAPDLDFYQQIYFHKLGTPIAQDAYALGKDFSRIAETRLDSSDDGNHVLAAVANGDGGEFAHYILGGDGEWAQVTRFEDKVVEAKFGLREDLYLLSRSDAARGKVLRLSLADLKLKDATVAVAESAVVIQDIVPTLNRLYTLDLVGGLSQIRIFDRANKALGAVKLAAFSGVGGVISTRDDRILFQERTYVEPGAWREYDPRTSLDFETRKTAMVPPSPVDFSDIEVIREMAVSKDGTQVPLNILLRKGVKRDGRNPLLLTGYGGYGVSLEPYFSPDLHLWLEHGGVYAVALLRGGGEFGEEWHRAGNLAKKQNVFSDFIACAEHLIHARYTNPRKLAIEGGSNGGLLMGAALTQRPDLFAAVVSHVGIYDMLRVEHDPNGAFNVTEFGSVKDPEQFRALYAYSPYHHVVDGKVYPPTLLLTGANDGRVEPYHSKKMAARLQANSASHAPVLLRVTFDGGHGIGRSLSQKVAEESDVYAFLFKQLGVK